MRWRRLALGALAGGGAVGLGLVALLAWTFSGMGAMEERALPGGGKVVKDGYVSVAVVPAGPDLVALVDAGNDASGAAILRELAARGIGPEAVTAILLTHGHPDHTAACGLFPNATTYAAEAELPMLRGEVGSRGPVTRWFGPRASGCAKLVGVADGGTVSLGDREATLYAVPGHTPGSAAWRVDDVLYVGDSADAAADGSLAPAKWMFTDDPAVNEASLRALAGRADLPATVICAHSGPLTTEALRRWAR